jgi:hypothetical protein
MSSVFISVHPRSSAANLIFWRADIPQRLDDGSSTADARGLTKEDLLAADERG